MARHFAVDEIRPAWIHINTPEGMPVPPEAPRDGKGLPMMAPYLLRAHKPD